MIVLEKNNARRRATKENLNGAPGHANEKPPRREA
jgi:hypothetical protein